jgi:hypothetical protein
MSKTDKLIYEQEDLGADDSIVSQIANAENEKSMTKGSLTINSRRSGDFVLELNDIEEDDEDAIDPNVYFVDSIHLIANFILDSLFYILDKPHVKMKISEIQNMFEPHVLLHIAKNKRMGKMYIEYDLDYYLRHILIDADEYRDFCYDVSTKINKNYKYEIVRFWPEIVNPRYDGVACGQNDILTLDTVSYWRSINGRFMFLEDKVECDMDRTKYKLNSTWTEFTRKMDLYIAKVHNINSNLINKNYTIPEAFQKYKELYNEEFGYELSGLDYYVEEEALENRYVFIELVNLLQYYKPPEED